MSCPDACRNPMTTGNNQMLLRSAMLQSSKMKTLKATTRSVHANVGAHPLILENYVSDSNTICEQELWQ